jgi:gliding motility-associated-like protein
MYQMSLTNLGSAFKGRLNALLSAVALLFVSVNASGQAVVCPPNIDFSFGSFTNWTCFTGTSTAGTISSVLTGAAISGPIAGPPSRHTLTTGTGTDFYGGFPVTAPGGGLFSALVGNAINGAEAERIRYYIHVPVGFNNYSFDFKYAVVFEDPGHAPTEQPAFVVSGYDSATGNPVPCATLTYIAAASLPGFSTSPQSSIVRYLPWTNGNLNLSGQGGKTIVVDVTSTDCTLSGHFGYGYFDVLSCGRFAATIVNCNLATGFVTVGAPAGYQYYQWFSSLAPTVQIGSTQFLTRPVPTTPSYFYCVITPYNSNGCPDTIRTKTIANFTVNATPDTVCNSLGNPIQLNITHTTGIGGTFNTSWIPDTTLSCYNCTSPIASPFTSGYYVGTVTDSNGCFRSDTVYIENPTFTIDLGPDRVTCLGTSVNLTPTITPPSPGYIFKWSPSGKLSNATISNPTFTPTAIGYDTLAVRMDSSLCATSDTMVIRTLPNSFAVFDTAVCQAAIITPTLVGIPEFSYKWSPSGLGSGISPDTGRVVGIVADSTKTWTITAKYPGCPDMVKTFTLRVEPVPTVDVGPPQVVKCKYTPLFLTARVTPTWYTNYTYKWTTNDLIDNLTTPIITYSGWEDTTLILTVKTPLGCTGVDSIRVINYNGDFGSVTPVDTAICPREGVVFTAAGGVKYQWDPPLFLNSANSATVLSTPVTSTEYTLYVTDKNGCLDTLHTSITVHPDAVVSVPDSAVLYPGQQYQIDPGGNCLYFTWFPTVGLNNPNLSNPLATPSVNTRYYVTATTEAGCVAHDSIYVLVHDESVLNMPNAFSPGSNPNPEFKVSHLGTATLKAFRVYNRWGTKVFETTDINKGWNGQFNGEPQPMGVYIYTVEAVTNKGKAFTKQGNVTLVR